MSRKNYRQEERAGHGSHGPNSFTRGLLETTLVDDVDHAPRELRARDELLADEAARRRGELADPEVYTGQVAAAPQEGVVQGAHVLRVRPVPALVLGAARESRRDRFDLVVHAGCAALRCTELPDPVVE